MATVKKTTKVTKKADEVNTIDQLRDDLATKTADLLQARRGNAAGELTNPRIITVTRKEIARLNFAIHANELAASKETK
ncbi:50S ribosomal protein L29 [Patescibacteria group bacterium]|nr:MAG: 50S ribosomal protein L29 [Patescibacteria group bacterium]